MQCTLLKYKAMNVDNTGSVTALYAKNQKAACYERGYDLNENTVVIELLG